MNDPTDIIETFMKADGPRRVDLCGGDDSPVLIEVVEGLEALLTRDAKMAVDAGLEIASFARDLGNMDLAARSMRSTVTALAYTGEHARSIDLALEARAIASEAGASEEAARALVAAMHPRCETGQIEEAIKGGEIARRELIDLGRKDLAIRVDLNLGNVRKMQGEAGLAIEHLERVLDAIGDDDPIRPHALNATGECWYVLDDLVRADAAFEEAQRIFDEKDGVAWSVVVGNRADVAAREGRFQESIDLFRIALARSDSLGLDSTSARLTIEFGEVLGQAGMTDEAIAEIEGAMGKIESTGLTFESGRACLALGTLNLKLGRFEDAVSMFDRARILFTSIDNRRMVDRSQILAVEADLNLGRLDSAEATLSSVRGARGLDEPTAEDVRWWYLFSQLAKKREKHPDALGAARTALDISLKLGLRSLIIDAQTNLSDNLVRMGFVADALTTARAAVEGVDRIREGFTASRMRGSYLASRTGPYEALVAALVARGRIEDITEAFMLVERARNRDLVERLDRGLEDGVASDPEVESIRRRLRGLYASLDDDGIDDQRRSRMDLRQREIDRLEIDLDRRILRSQGETGGASGFDSIEDVTALVPRDGAIVQYFICGERMFVFSLSGHTPEAFEIPASLEEIDAAVAEVHFQCRRRLRGEVGPNLRRRMQNACDEALSHLYEMLVEPLPEAIKRARRWLVVPTGPLVAVPFHALRTGDEYVMDRTVVTTTSSLETAQRLSTIPHRGSGVLVATVSDDRAPAIRVEGDRVAETYPSVHRLDGPGADAGHVLDELTTVEIAHIACHGRFLPGSPRSSGLRLCDRWVTVRDVRELANTPPVVVLSGCETGLHPQAGANELLGLARSFAAGGSRSVVASLWSVHDATSTTLMTRIHRRLAADPRGGIGAILSEVQREMRNQEPHPAFWAPFFCSEPPMPFARTR